MSDARSIWMPLYIGDYLANTLHLTAEEHGAYMLLLMYYWKNRGAIKNDRKLISNITRLSYNRLKNVLPFFEERDGTLFHKRAEEELKRTSEIQDKNKQRTQKATEARKRNVEARRPADNHVTVFQPSTPPISHYNILSTVAPDLNLNNFIHAYEVMCLLLGVKQFSKNEQEILAGWCEVYSMREFVLPVIAKSLERFRECNHGAVPHSLAYFNKILERQSVVGSA